MAVYDVALKLLEQLQEMERERDVHARTACGLLLVGRTDDARAEARLFKAVDMDLQILVGQLQAAAEADS